MSWLGQLAGSVLGSVDPTGTVKGFAEGAIDGKDNALADEHEQHRDRVDTVKTIGDATGLTDIYQGLSDLPGIGPVLKQIPNADPTDKIESGGIKAGGLFHDLMNPFAD